MKVTTDDLGFKWLVVTDPELDGLVTRIHGANTTMVEHGLGPRLLCAVFGFVPKTPPGDGAVRMVYLLKQGTFYPFAPTGPNQRDNELELRVRSFVGDDLPMEKDLSRWMALWTAAVVGPQFKAQSSVAEHHLGVMVEPFGERHLRLQESNAARVVSRPDVTNQM